MREEKAVFLTKRRALQAAINAAVKAGASQELMLRTCKAQPVYKRGEIRGYTAWFVSHRTTNSQPVLAVGEYA